jgi:hypothetical protein
MKLHHTLALLLAALAACLPARAAEITQTHSAYASNWHCCWDNFYKIDSQQGTGNVSALAWFASGQAGGNANYGHLTGSASGVAPFPDGGYTQSIGEGRVRDAWAEQFTIISSQLAPGTPVQVQVWLTVSGSLSAQRGPSGGYAVADVTSALHFDGYDAPWITGASFSAGGMGPSADYSAKGGSRQVSATFASAVGSQFTLAHDLVVWAHAEGGPGNPATANAQGAAYFAMQVMTPGAGYMTASGSSYLSSPVPEPHALALLLAGVGVVGAFGSTRWRGALKPGGASSS